MLQVVPVFVAVLVWLIRVLIIGTFSSAGDHLFNLNITHDSVPAPQANTHLQPRSQTQSPRLAEGAQTIAASRAANYRSASSSVTKSGGRSTVANATMEMQANDPGLDHPMDHPNNRPERRYVPISNDGQLGNRYSNNSRNNSGERSNTQPMGRP
jgi:hypothetical protein